ncbi:hypothetical protein OEA66_00520 [Chryseobacterium sp. KC 927]|uniref:DUF2007 domain-containing protein n=1 Tax=Chryseobacterium luquanense TaxID=2983766 RepID=A0ABT3XY56_9FLAO|nr:hypothetical protein [Chryseobacterium luquanense]
MLKDINHDAEIKFITDFLSDDNLDYLLLDQKIAVNALEISF